MNYSWPSGTGILNLLYSIGHSVEASRERRRLSFSRVGLAAGLLSALTLAWVAIDAFTLRWPVWGILAFERICAAAAFVLLVFRRYQGLSYAAAVGSGEDMPTGFRSDEYFGGKRDFDSHRADYAGYWRKLPRGQSPFYRF